MIKWCDKLYCDSYTEKRQAKIRKKLEQEKITLACWCITLPVNKENLLDIICANELLFRYYREQEMTVAGLASDRESAIDLVQQIIEDVHRETGGFDVASYLCDGKTREGQAAD